MRKLINTILVEISQFSDLKRLSQIVPASGGHVCKSVGGSGC